MTREGVEALGLGELCIRAAELYGWTQIKPSGRPGVLRGRPPQEWIDKGVMPDWEVPHYTTSMGAAWDLMERLTQHHLMPAIDAVGDMWSAWAKAPNLKHGARFTSKSAPEAVCRAFVWAMTQEQDKGRDGA